MTHTPFAPTIRPTAIAVRGMLPWTIFGGIVLLLAIYFVGAREGTTLPTFGFSCH